ncbi:MAG: acyl-CoA thioesterase [Bacteroidales bacterium]|nr:acyl-CoA thioesterase [Bacteroidales bacterium]
MISNTTYFRVSYSDTDQMGFMHHSNYFKYYETARWELLRKIGIPYNEIEKKGIILPVINSVVKFLRPALYDQEIKIITQVKSFNGIRIIFDNRAINESGEIINEALITVAFVKKSTGKACSPPEELGNMLKEKINK